MTLGCSQARMEMGFTFLKMDLGIDELNEKLIKKQVCADFPPPWTPTKEWDKEWSNDRRWS